MIRELKIEGDSVDRGTPVTLTAIFTCDPVEVHASFMKPGQSRAIVDPGFGKNGSRIRRVDFNEKGEEIKGVYVYVIDTTGFPPGRVTWHVWGPGEASEFGWFEINDRPAQLL